MAEGGTSNLQGVSSEGVNKKSKNKKPTKAEMQAPRKQRGRKPKDMPKRPMSAYNVFFKHERVRMLDEQAAANGKSLGFEGMGKAIGAKWKNLTENERAKYRDFANTDMKRYRCEVQDYEEMMAIRSRLDRKEAARIKRERQSVKKALNRQASHPQRTASAASAASAASSSLRGAAPLMFNRRLLDQRSTALQTRTCTVQTQAWTEQLATMLAAQQQYPMDRQSMQQSLTGMHPEMRRAPLVASGRSPAAARNLPYKPSSNTQSVTLNSVNNFLIQPQSSYHGALQNCRSSNFLNENQNKYHLQNAGLLALLQQDSAASLRGGNMNGMRYPSLQGGEALINGIFRNIKQAPPAPPPPAFLLRESVSALYRQQQLLQQASNMLHF